MRCWIGLLTVENFQRLLTKIRAALADPAVADELRRLGGEMSRLRRLVGNLLDAVEEGGGRDVKERLKARGDELARLETQHAELQQRQTLAAFELADGELADVLDHLLLLERSEAGLPDVVGALAEPLVDWTLLELSASQ